MILWISIAIVTGLSALILVMPLRRSARPVTDGFAYDAEVYKDQLKELGRDEKDGLISAEQAEYARGEIGRRLLAVSSKGTRDKNDAAASSRKRWILQGLVILLIPVLGLGLYLKEGAPSLPDQPLEARLANPGNNIELLIAKMERHLAEEPQDGEGWQIIAPVYSRLQRYEDAVNAYRNAVRFLPPDAERFGALGEALVASAKGQVTPEAEIAFGKSLELSPDNPRAEFYLALSKAQQGKSAEATRRYQALLDKSPADALWVPLVRQAMAELGAPSGKSEALGNPDAGDIAAAEELSANDRQQMIRGMVASLDEKLREQPDNFEGWKRLVRSYMVLKEELKAKGALKRALAQFPPDKDQGRALLAEAKALGLSITGLEP